MNTFDAVVSTGGENRPLDLSTLKLDRFRKNPIVAYQHGAASKPEGKMPIGKATDVRIEGGKLLARITFAKSSKLAQQVERLVGEKMIRGVFAYTVGGEVKRGRLVGAELASIAIVPIPADPKATISTGAPTPKTKRAKASAERQPRRFECIRRSELAKLATRFPERYEAMRRDWLRRGAPERRAL